MKLPDNLESQVTTDSNSLFVCPHAGASKFCALTRACLVDAQRLWISSFLAIAEAYRQGNDARSVAVQMIEGLYDYSRGPVLFKPTLAFGDQTFRTTFAGAVSYFVGGDPNFPNDKGFALNDWISVYPQNTHCLIDCSVGMTMGNFVFVKSSGSELVVEKTFVFKSDATGKLRIVLHHASLPFKLNQ